MTPMGYELQIRDGLIVHQSQPPFDVLAFLNNSGWPIENHETNTATVL
jgi:hypothetical protein